LSSKGVVLVGSPDSDLFFCFAWYALFVYLCEDIIPFALFVR